MHDCISLCHQMKKTSSVRGRCHAISFSDSDEEGIVELGSIRCLHRKQSNPSCISLHVISPLFGVVDQKHTKLDAFRVKRMRSALQSVIWHLQSHLRPLLISAKHISVGISDPMIVHHRPESAVPVYRAVVFALSTSALLLVKKRRIQECRVSVVKTVLCLWLASTLASATGMVCRK